MIETMDVLLAIVLVLALIWRLGGASATAAIGAGMVGGALVTMGALETWHPDVLRDRSPVERADLALADIKSALDRLKVTLGETLTIARQLQGPGPVIDPGDHRPQLFLVSATRFRPSATSKGQNRRGAPSPFALRLGWKTDAASISLKSANVQFCPAQMTGNTATVPPCKEGLSDCPPTTFDLHCPRGPALKIASDRATAPRATIPQDFQNQPFTFFIKLTTESPALTCELKSPFPLPTEPIPFTCKPEQDGRPR